MAPGIEYVAKSPSTWTRFNENEAEIVKVLQDHPNYSLERAYQTVVLPKLEATQKAAVDTVKADRDKMRAEILAELKQAPRSTSAPAQATKVAQVTSAGPQGLEDIIAAAIKTIK